MPGIARVMVVAQNANGMPADRYISTFHTRATGITDDVGRALIAQAFVDFYNYEDPGGVWSPVSTYLGPQVSRAASVSKVIVYDLGEAQPRTPHTFTFTMKGAPGVGDYQKALPGEVACCLSLKSDHNGPRGMGRAFIGPLNQAAVSNVFDSGEARPSQPLMTALAMSAGRLKAALIPGSNTEWVILSRVDDAVYPVVKGWVDNAFDTMRSRGLKASSRLLWPVT
jgi:hypothetical protein